MPQSGVRARNLAVAGLLGAGVLAMAIYPMYASRRNKVDACDVCDYGEKSLYASKDPLKGSQIMRGPYVNSGSQDAGPDPSWDHERGTWKGKRNRIVPGEGEERKG